jgi:hypothetical protein
MDDVFIGYSRKDAAAVAAIYDCLTNAGYSCYRDVTNIPGGEEWIRSISAAIRSCYAYVAVLSNNSVNSEYVDMELHWGIKWKKKFVSVALQPELALPETVGFVLERFQTIDASTGVAEVLPLIAGAVNRIVDPVRHQSAYSDGLEVGANANTSQMIDFSEINLIGSFSGRKEAQVSVSGRSCNVTSSSDSQCLIPLAGHNLHDFVLHLTMRKLAGPDVEWFGLEFGQIDPDPCHQVALNGSGAALIQTRTASGWLVRWRTENSRRPWSHANRAELRVVRKRSVLHLFLDGSHVASCSDKTVSSGELRLLVGKGLTVEFSAAQVQGFDLQKAYLKAWEHREALEQREARAILERIALCNPSFAPTGSKVTAGALLDEVRPDYRETVLIAVANSAEAQISDFPAASYLRNTIDSYGKGGRFRWAATITANDMLEAAAYSRCAVIGVGGPAVNEFTRTLPDLPPNPLKVALWGEGTRDTAEEVRRFVESGRLAEFLDELWAETNEANAADRVLREGTGSETMPVPRKGNAEQREQEQRIADAITAAVARAEQKWEVEADQRAVQEHKEREAAMAEQLAAAIASAVADAESRWNADVEIKAEQVKRNREAEARIRAQQEQKDRETEERLRAERERKERFDATFPFLRY